MFKISVSTTRSAVFCLAAACFASTAQADVIGVGGMPATVSDALLASTHAANISRSLVTSIGSAGPTTIAPVNSTTVANNVRLWDEVIPPAPSPKPTQASLPATAQPRTTMAVSSTPQTTVGMMATNLKVNASGRMGSAAAR
ncbi:hypothetical protein [Pandoraea sputorum]|uniref:Uncharacterized protein n=1 Tax=Pandoraea sputorum TaxID=93222 RepID=A0A239SLW3_9BURK|nr:hypothetical protein [Pandoraea sputorum]AJC17485.1 hypothetical protein NA29_18645 [Pandoraea sputorum]SNU85828.1 Uncharacterised protein [Pandoraea sputorum]VVD99291.1 hypothetical protein PSP20601_02044 [Pandoraea sputorum]VVE79795.1 hypothetical protein PSP31120_02413 [Pandoraea sputorum]